MSPRLRSGLLAALLSTGLCTIAWQKAWIDPVRLLKAPATPADDTVVFIVLDTVRADRMSACGYERPTTPVLEALAADHPLSCDAYAPGSWTLPSHASYFTGLEVPEHGAHSLAQGGEVLGHNTSEQVRPLGPEPQTLAEAFSARGYDTLSVSGNPVVSEASGLTRGFDHQRAPGRFGSWYGQDLVRQLQHGLESASHADRPLFVFVNIADAHVPWTAIPEGVGWVPARPGLDWSEGTLWADFLGGRMGSVARQDFLAHLSDLYDYGVHRADQALGEVIGKLSAWNRLGPGSRLVITSDHGEYLGEDDLIDHGHYLGEPNNRVFLMANQGGPFPTPVSALAAHGLVLDGALPDPLPPTRAAAYPHAQRAEWAEERWFTRTSAAGWSADQKVLWSDEQGWTTGARGGPLSSSPPDPHLEPFVQAVQASGVPTGEVDPALLEALRAAGYMD
ncbi:MAG: sulfatase-like hydrolase/transferase [Myxococcota bacterium]|nr:sulfatase-like hydrolase/transferase [Myxococcota bacterium]